MCTCNTCQTRCNRDTHSTYRGQQMYTLCIHISMSMHTLYTHIYVYAHSVYIYLCLCVLYIHISMSMHTLYTYRERVHLLRCIRGNVLQCECAQSVYRGQQMYTLHTHRVCTSVASVAPYIQKARILYTEVRMLHIGSYVWGPTHGRTVYTEGLILYTEVHILYIGSYI